MMDRVSSPFFRRDFEKRQRGIKWFHHFLRKNIAKKERKEPKWCPVIKKSKNIFRLWWNWSPIHKCEEDQKPSERLSIDHHRWNRFRNNRNNFMKITFQSRKWVRKFIQLWKTAELTGYCEESRHNGFLGHKFWFTLVLQSIKISVWQHMRRRCDMALISWQTQHRKLKTRFCESLKDTNDFRFFMDHLDSTIDHFKWIHWGRQRSRWQQGREGSVEDVTSTKYLLMRKIQITFHSKTLQQYRPNLWRKIQR